MAGLTPADPDHPREIAPASAASSLEERLVWIFGSPRSGSTWLLRLLVYPWDLDQSEIGIGRLLHRPPGGAIVPVDESYLPVHLAPLLPGSAADGQRRLLNDRRAADPAYFFSDAYRRSWIDGARRLALDRYDAQAKRAEADLGISSPLVVVKEPNGSHAADAMAELLPGSRIIFLLRDGRDVIDSMLEADSPGGWRTRREGVTPLTTPEQRMAVIREQAALWLIRTSRRGARLRAARSRPMDRAALRGPASGHLGELGRVDAWLGLGRSEGVLRQAVRAHRFTSLRNRVRGKRNGVRAASPGLWRENLSATEQEAMQEILGPKLAELGYPE